METDTASEGTEGGAYGSGAVAEGWQRGAAARAQALGPLTERMLDLAGVGPGTRVLDVAAGTGEQTLLAARRVGPTGSVLATDLAAPMLAVAAEAAREAGLTNVQTQVQDARQLAGAPDSFDAAICRLGLMLIADRERALTSIYRLLKTGGRLGAVVFSSPEQNQFVSAPLALMRRSAGLPPAPLADPGRFALAAPERLQAVYQQAGFREITIEEWPVERRFPAAAAAVQYLIDALPEVGAGVSAASDADRSAILAELMALVEPFAGPEGVIVPGEYLVGVATK